MVTLPKDSALTFFFCWRDMATVGGSIWIRSLSAFFFSTFSSCAFLARLRANTWIVTVAFLTRNIRNVTRRKYLMILCSPDEADDGGRDEEDQHEDEDAQHLVLVCRPEHYHYHHYHNHHYHHYDLISFPIMLLIFSLRLDSTKRRSSLYLMKMKSPVTI